MSFLPQDRTFSKRWMIDYSLIIIGSIIVAIGYDYFISPHRIVPGGVYGIAIVVHHITKGIFPIFPEGLPVGLFGLILNIPLLYAGIRILGPRFGIKTVVGIILTSAFMDLITLLRENGEAPLVDDVLLSCVFGGVLIGFGLGLIFKSRATSGGSDIIAMIFSKYSGIPVGQMLIYVDSVIVLLGLAVFKDWKIPLYSWLAIYITGKAIDLVLEGRNYNKAMIIISDKYEEIRDKIIVDIERGGTYLLGKGMYSDKEKHVIYTVISRREVTILERYIQEIDPDAFIAIMDTREILGEGFNSLKNKVEN